MGGTKFNRWVAPVAPNFIGQQNGWVAPNFRTKFSLTKFCPKLPVQIDGWHQILPQIVSGNKKDGWHQFLTRWVEDDGWHQILPPNFARQILPNFAWMMHPTIGQEICPGNASKLTMESAQIRPGPVSTSIQR